MAKAPVKKRVAAVKKKAAPKKPEISIYAPAAIVTITIAAFVFLAVIVARYV